MDKLKAAGLYGGGLVPVSGSLARRYNDCLAMLGVTATTLPSFSLDAMGWSPEIALEKKDNFYLSSGEANSNAIIISPEQRHKPAHMPNHSFDRDLMEAVFTAFAKAIKDITKDAALCVHIDQKIDTFYDPFDLLRYDKITVTFELLYELDKRQKEQWNLIKTPSQTSRKRQNLRRLTQASIKIRPDDLRGEILLHKGLWRGVCLKRFHQRHHGF